ncbi:MAG: VaFE repeat-containing surface-anchored protein [Lachnospiraceae bacterium]|nr:VaFE repeat-containing surface-anchored protein [Lachnospiraceae bacterium]
MKKRIISFLMAGVLLLSPLSAVQAAEPVELTENTDTGMGENSEDSMRQEEQTEDGETLQENTETEVKENDPENETDQDDKEEAEEEDLAESDEKDDESVELAEPGAEADDMAEEKLEYFKENVRSSLSRVTKLEPANIIWVKQTLVDGSTFKGTNFGQLYANLESAMSLIAMYDDAMYIYNTDDESKYYIAKIDTMQEDMESEVTDILFARNNLNGETLSGCIYDTSNGLCYIPKKYFVEKKTEWEILGVQVQLLQKCTTPTPTTTVDVAVHNENINEAIAGSTEIETDALDIETRIPVAMDEDARKTVKEDDITVLINGEESDTEAYEYSKETGEVVIPTSPTNLDSVEVHVERENVFKKLANSLVKPLTVHAATTLAQMKVIRSKNGKDCDDYKKYCIQVDGDPSKSVGVVMVSNKCDAMYHSDAILKSTLQNREKDKGKNWERMYGIVGSGNSNDKLREMANMIGKSGNTSYKKLKEVENINTNQTVNFAFDMGTATWKDKTHGITYAGTDAWLTCKCSHISNPNTTSWSGGDGHDDIKAKIVMRILKVQEVKNDPKISGYMIMGFLTPTAYGQSGMGIYKIPYRNDEEEEKPGKLRVIKKSTDPDMTSGNPSYSLKGAKFVVYTDEDCTKKAKTYSGESYATLKSGSDGKTGYVMLAPGTYYVKETKAPKGFELPDPNEPKKVKVKANQSKIEKYSLSFKDKPTENPLVLLLKKLDATAEGATSSGGSDPYSDASAEDDTDIDEEGNPISADSDSEEKISTVAGAQYTIKLWEPVSTDSDNADATTIPSTSSDPETQSYTYTEHYMNGDTPATSTETREFKDYGPKDTWVFATDDQGLIALDEEHLVTGSLSELTRLGEFYSLPLGHVLSIKETKAPEGYRLDDNVYVISTDDLKGELSYSNAPTSSDLPYLGGVEVQKRDIETLETEPQGDITFEGTKFEIVNQSQGEVIVAGVIYQPGETVCTMFADANGYAKTPTARYLPAGDYSCEETSPAIGNTNVGMTIRYFSITEEDDNTYKDLKSVSTSILNRPVRGGFKLQKRDWETKDDSPLGGASFENIKVEVTNNSKYKVLVDGERYQPGQVCATLYTDNSGVIETAEDYLPYGSYTLTEVYKDAEDQRIDKISQAGYKREGVYTRTFTIRQDGVIVDMTDVGHSMINWVMRGDFEMRKIDATSQRRMSNISFKITSVTNGESHMFTTDANGEYRSCSEWNPHSKNTNGGGEQDGLWFGTTGNGAVAPVDDSLPALPFDRYHIEELPCEANKGKVLYDDIITIYKDKQVIYLNNIENLDKPQLASQANGDITDMPLSQYCRADEDAMITDVVSYDNLTKDYIDKNGVSQNYKYTLIGWLVDKSTGDEIKVEGKRIETSQLFKPKSSTGTVRQRFLFDASTLAGKTVVVFEKMVAESPDGKNTIHVASHEDLSDEDQTIYFPGMGTSAKGKRTNDQIVNGMGTVEITDTVDYFNLYPGLSYRVGGVLMDKTTGKPLLDKTGKKVESEQTFKADKKDGSVEVTFTFEAPEDLPGKDLVVFEELFHGISSYAEHKNINDEGQTVHVPKIRTTANDENTGDHVGRVTRDQVSGSKIVRTRRLLINKDKGLKTEIVTGRTISHTKTDGGLSADYVTGTITEGTIKSDHISGDKVKLIPQTTTIRDSVWYENVIPGRNYIVRGKLYNKATGEVLKDRSGKIYTAERTFAAPFSSGFVDLFFEVDSSVLTGQTAVAFEDLYFNNIDVATHADLKDEDQSIHFPEIGTTAIDAETGEHLGSKGKKITLTDTVSYKNLIPGQEYLIRGILMDKETGEAYKTSVKAVGNGAAISSATNGRVTVIQPPQRTVITGGNVITAETKFKAVTTDGSIHLSFNLDSRGLEGKTLVAFEELIHNNVIVTDHEDIKDEGQSIHFPKIRTTAEDSKTKDHIMEKSQNGRLIDHVKYENLIPGLKYTLMATLMDKGTNEPLTRERVETSTGAYITGIFDAAINAISGTENTKKTEPITAKIEFIPTKSSGMIDVPFEIDTRDFAGKTGVVFEKLYFGEILIADHEDIDDEYQTVYFPDVHTTAEDAKTKEHIAQVTEYGKLIDHVTYENLIPGLEYTIVGTLMDKETGKPITGSGLKISVATSESIGTDNGYSKDVTGKVTFIPTERNGTIDVFFDIDSEGLEGKTGVIYEYLYLKDTLIASHEDIEDAGQSVHFPKIRTTAEDGKTGSHVMEKSEEGKLIDHVRYENLIPGFKYILRATLIDKDTGEPITKTSTGSSITGILNSGVNTASTFENIQKTEPITASIEFTPTEANGIVDVPFDIDTPELAGKTGVVFEKLYFGEVLITDHEDINDEEQTVYFPDIHTTAEDAKTNEHIAQITEDGKLIDHVTYENLVPGLEYTLSGKLMDKKTQKPIARSDIKISKANGENAKTNISYIGNTTGEVTFIPTEPDGVIDLYFDIDSEGLVGKTGVIYEYMYLGNILIASHEDIEDEEQTIYYPGMRTTATIGGKKLVPASGDVKLKDIVTYKNLVPGLKYTVEGYLMDKSTGKKFKQNGEVVKSYANFKPKKKDGKVEVEFEFSADDISDGTKLVVFEKLMVKDVPIFYHYDIEDEAQTVEFNHKPSPKTGDYIWIIMVVMGAGLIGAAFFVRRRRSS